MVMSVDLVALVDSLTLEEQVSLLAGQDSWSVNAIPGKGVPYLRLSDGPNGARGGEFINGVSASAFPAGVSLASSWNEALVAEVGAALAGEALSKGARVLLAPTVNLHRSPLNGRTFEAFSEDPYLTGKLAVAYVKGLQGRGVAATVKHFVGNESEFERTSISSEIGERALRELYLRPFEMVVREGGAWCVMTAYNKVNGVYAAENPWTLGVLRREWGFDGLVMSDWFGTHSTADAANASLDLEMPGPTQWRGEKLVAAVREGQVEPGVVRESALRVLRTMERVGAFEHPEPQVERAQDLPETRALIRRAGAEGVVLLRNLPGVLPLAGGLESLAVIGPNADVARIMGGGSAQVNAHYRVTPLEGLRAALPGVSVAFARGCDNERFTVPVKNLAVSYFNTPDLSGAVVATGQATGECVWMGLPHAGVDPAVFSASLKGSFTPDVSGPHRLGLASAGRSRLLLDGREVIENWDSWRPGGAFFGMGSDELTFNATLEAGRTYALEARFASLGQPGLYAVRVGVSREYGEADLSEALRVASEADAAVVFVGGNQDWDTEGIDRFGLNLPGPQDELVRRVASVNPRTIVVLQTGGPVLMPWLNDVEAVLQAWYPGQECGNAIADVLTGAVDATGRLPTTFPARLEDHPAFFNYPGENGRVQYGENLFIGYRHYDAAGVTPLFPFGFGLSYTTFRLSNARAANPAFQPGETVSLTVNVQNSGARAGSQVVQLYLEDAESRLRRPVRELKAFAKVSLQPGEARDVTLSLEPRAFAYFDDAARAWVSEAGEFTARIGTSSDNLPLSVTLTLSETTREDVGGEPQTAGH